MSSVLFFHLLLFLVQWAQCVDISGSVYYLLLLADIRKTGEQVFLNAGTSATLCRTKEFSYAANDSSNGSHDCRVTGACFPLNQVLAYQQNA